MSEPSDSPLGAVFCDGSPLSAQILIQESRYLESLAFGRRLKLIGGELPGLSDLVGPFSIRESEDKQHWHVLLHGREILFEKKQTDLEEGYFAVYMPYPKDGKRKLCGKDLSADALKTKIVADEVLAAFELPAKIPFTIGKSELEELSETIKTLSTKWREVAPYQKKLGGEIAGALARLTTRIALAAKFDSHANSVEFAITVLSEVRGLEAAIKNEESKGKEINSFTAVKSSLDEILREFEKLDVLQLVGFTFEKEVSLEKEFEVPKGWFLRLAAVGQTPQNLSVAINGEQAISLIPAESDIPSRSNKFDLNMAWYSESLGNATTADNTQYKAKLKSGSDSTTTYYLYRKLKVNQE